MQNSDCHEMMDRSEASHDVSVSESFENEATSSFIMQYTWIFFKLSFDGFMSSTLQQLQSWMWLFVQLISRRHRQSWTF